MDETWNRLSKEKERLFRESVLRASASLHLSKPPKVKIWDGACPHGDGREIAHAHPDIGVICISRGRLASMNFDEIKDTAFHETSHMLEKGHDAGFHGINEEAKLRAWMKDHEKNSKIKLKSTKSGKNECNYNQCHKKGKLIKCRHCGNYYCEQHKRPKLATTFENVSTAKEPERSILEKAYRSNDGHPDFVYTKKFWAGFKKKGEEELEKRWNFYEGLKKFPIFRDVVSRHTYEAPRDIFPMKTQTTTPHTTQKSMAGVFVAITLLALVAFYFYKNPDKLNFIISALGNFYNQAMKILNNFNQQRTPVYSSTSTTYITTTTPQPCCCLRQCGDVKSDCGRLETCFGAYVECPNQYCQS
jgi:hypothetical protein